MYLVFRTWYYQRNMTHSITIFIFAFCLAGLLGCGAREEIVISEVKIDQTQWDSLRVYVSFARQVVLGRDRPVEADSVHIVAYSASYDTLYAGSNTRLNIADGNLGSSERILIEVCGIIKKVSVCEQTATSASPKRIRLTPDIAYPWRDRYYQGSYRLPFVVERRPFGIEEERWEPIERTKSIEGFIQAHVEGRTESPIRVPFTKPQGGFNLTHYSNYKDFKYYLDSSLLDENKAAVQFDVYVNVPGIYDTVGSIRKDILPKTDEEHQGEVARLARLAAEQLVDRLNPYLEERRNVVFIDRWRYNAFTRIYTVELELEWSGRLFNRRRYQMNGVLEIREKDLKSSFTLVDANRQTRRLWEQATEKRSIDLEPLDHYDRSAAPRNNPSPRFSHVMRDDVLIIEAEAYQQTRSRSEQSWTIRQEPDGFEGQGAMAALPDKGIRVRNNVNRYSPGLAYEIVLPDDDTYYAWFRVWARDGNSNSLYAGMNERDIVEIDTGEYRKWTWMRSGDRGRARFRVRRAGTHTLNIWMREDGLYLDRIVITKDRSFRPRD